MSDQRKRKAVRAPISAHPAFPTIVSAWFAGLLGLGSLVLPVALFEAMSEASGLASVVVAAQAPLGPTARLLIAAVAAGVGALAGLGIARRVIAANGPAVSPSAVASQAEPAKRPIRAHDELGDEGFDADLELLAQPTFAERLNAWTPSEDKVSEPTVALDLADFVAADDANPDKSDWISGDRKRDARGYEGLESDPPALDLATGTEKVADDGIEAEPVQPVPARPVSARPLNELRMVELVERFAHALQRHQDNLRSASSAGADTVVDLTAALAVKAGEQSPERTAGEGCLEEAEDARDESYSSLLAMKSPLAGPRDRARVAARPDTERALRDALEKLQAMSGAA